MDPEKLPKMPVQPHATGQATLRDGRKLGWASFGDPSGDPVFWFHGTPGARCQLPAGVEEAAIARRLRVIGVERPGNGDSTEHYYERVVDFTDDLRQTADELGIERFGAVGLSGGGPFVLACAHEMPDRMTAGVVLGGVAPTHGSDLVVSPLLGLRLIGPMLDRVQQPVYTAVSGVIRRIAPYGRPFLEVFFLATWGDWREMAAQPESKHQLIGDIVDATMRSGLRAPLHDLVLFSRDWGFALGDIKVPITFWGGTADVIIPFFHAERQAKRIPGAMLRTVKGQGHFAGFTAVGDVLDAIRLHWPVVRPVEAAPKPRATRKKTAATARKRA